MCMEVHLIHQLQTMEVVGIIVMSLTLTHSLMN
jgi:hypothetical protein